MARLKRPPPAAPRRKEVASCHDVIAEVIASHRLAEELSAHQIIVQWPQLVGDRIAKRTWPDGLSGRVLWVRVASSAWLHELTLLKGQLLAGLIAALPPPSLFDELRFHLGSRRASDDDLLANSVRPTGRPALPVRRLAPASAARAAEIDREAAIVEDPQLRALIADLRKRIDR
ncbi:MAG: DUF721 domain-containing protein [Myxococcales bacterium]|nr:DUF721 domain-containing protein [Myxococcales bacterium]